MKVHKFMMWIGAGKPYLGGKASFVDGLLWWVMALLDARALGCNFKVFRALVCSHKVLHPDVLFPAILALPACLVMPTFERGYLVNETSCVVVESQEEGKMPPLPPPVGIKRKEHGK